MPQPPRPQPGEPVVFRWRKWDGGRHWEHACVYLGADDWGDWVGQPAGWISERPGRRVVAAHPNVTLVPSGGEWAYTRNAAPDPVRTYIDLAWDVRFDEAGVPAGIDMDLDVADREGIIGIEDQDEWDVHRVRYGYPVGIVARLETVAAELERRVRAAEAPFDGVTGDRWLRRLAELHPASGS